MAVAAEATPRKGLISKRSAGRLPASPPTETGRSVIAVAVGRRVMGAINGRRVVNARLRGDKGDDRCSRRHHIGTTISPRWSVAVVTITAATGATVTGGCRTGAQHANSSSDHQL